MTPRQARERALEDITRLLKLLSLQVQKYGEGLDPNRDFYRRHLVVQEFLHRKLDHTAGENRRETGISVAKGYGKKSTYGRSIVR